MWNIKGYNKENNIINKLKKGQGYIKEYYKNILIFEGEYFNGEKNGKGKEYYLSLSEKVIKFEGDLFKWKKKWKR